MNKRTIIRPHFNAKAALTLQQKLDLMVRNLSPSDRVSYDMLLKQQAEGRKLLAERQLNERGELISHAYQEILAQKSVRNTLELRPKHMPGVSIAEMERTARQEAENIVFKREHQQVNLTEARHFEAQYNFLKQAEERNETRNSPGKPKADFNRGNGGLER